MRRLATWKQRTSGDATKTLTLPSRRAFMDVKSSAMRYFPNTLDEQNGFNKQEMQAYMRQLYDEVDAWQTRKPTVYTGAAGIAYSLWHVRHNQEDFPHAVHAALHHMESALQGVRAVADHQVVHSLMMGAAGVYFTAALVYNAAQHCAPDPQHAAKYRHLRDDCIKAYMAAHEAALDTDSDEFLYGRAGYLFGALLLNKEVGLEIVPQAVINRIAHVILASEQAIIPRPQYVRHASNSIVVAGRATARLVHGMFSGWLTGTAQPLKYLWPSGGGAYGGPQGEPYLGAAHGLMGILYVLLHCSQVLQLVEEQAQREVLACLKFVLSLECDAPGRPGLGGHYPTVVGNDSGSSERTLVHWCHGAPGAVFLFCKAYKFFGDRQYLKAAERAGELVWERGLLTKGPGLCHGVSGNTYALLHLWKTTGDDRWLQRAYKFCGFLAGPEMQQASLAPDHPLSLFEGKAGALCLVADMLRDPHQACFPFFEC